MQRTHHVVLNSLVGDFDSAFLRLTQTNTHTQTHTHTHTHTHTRNTHSTQGRRRWTYDTILTYGWESSVTHYTDDSGQQTCNKMHTLSRTSIFSNLVNVVVVVVLQSKWLRMKSWDECVTQWSPDTEDLGQATSPSPPPKGLWEIKKQLVLP